MGGEQYSSGLRVEWTAECCARGAVQSWAPEAMKRCDEALNFRRLNFFASVKRFIASLF
jgi:hypothetical protein